MSPVTSLYKYGSLERRHCRQRNGHILRIIGSTRLHAISPGWEQSVIIYPIVLSRLRGRKGYSFQFGRSTDLITIDRSRAERRIVLERAATQEWCLNLRNAWVAKLVTPHQQP